MTLKLGDVTINKFQLGVTEINKIFLGLEQIYPVGGQPWTPADIATNVWYDPSDLSTITDTGGLVDELRDKSGNTQNVTGAGVTRPITGTRTLNGLNVIDYDKTQVLENATLTIGDGSGDLAFFVVTEVDDATIDNASQAMFSFNATNDFQFDTNDIANFNGRITSSGIGGNIDFTGGPFNGPSIYNNNFDFTGTGFFNGFVDGTQRGADLAYTPNPIDALGVFRLMSNRNNVRKLDGGMGEFVVTDDMTTDTRYKLEGYLAHKWFGAGVQNNLPFEHPYKYFEPIAGEPAVLLWTPSSSGQTGMWYDAADTDTITESGGAVSQIDDKLVSGNAVQPTVGERPTTGTRTQNTLNVLDFDGNNSESLELLGASLPTTGIMAIFMFAEIDAIFANGSGPFSYDSTVGSADFQLDANSVTQFNARLNVSSMGINALTVNPPYPGPSIYNCNFNFDVSVSLPLSFYNVFVDALQEAPDTAYTTKFDTAHNFRIFKNRGDNQATSGAMGEYFRINDVTDATREKAEGYLAWKWTGGASNNLPPAHPYKDIPPTI